MNDVKWTEENGVIRFSVTSNGTTGEEWLARYNGYETDYTETVLRSDNFKPTIGTTKIVVLKGSLFEGRSISEKKIRDEAERRNLATPSVEVACLIKDEFDYHRMKDLYAMGIMGIVTMHNSITDYTGVGLPRNGAPGYITPQESLLFTIRCMMGTIETGFSRAYGFAFAESQTA